MADRKGVPELERTEEQGRGEDQEIGPQPQNHGLNANEDLDGRAAGKAQNNHPEGRGPVADETRVPGDRS